MSMIAPETFVSDPEDAPFSELVPPHGEGGRARSRAGKQARSIERLSKKGESDAHQ